jgi:non-heme Fe2+,alpha-ketoglutarate-dependent halogenase
MQSSKPNFSLSAEELKNFHENGFAGPFTLYEPEEMEAKLKKLRPQLMDNRKSIYYGGEGISGVTNISNYDRHLDIDFLADHICRAEIVDRVASIFGPDLFCWRSEFFPKYPGDEGTDWHQAGSFANVAAAKKKQIEWPENAPYRGTLTVWTAFTEATIDNGCMQFIPGTHKTMFYDENKTLEYDANNINKLEKDGVKRGFFGYDYRQLQIDPNWKPDESQAVSMVMKPGQFFIFTSTLLHASHPHSGKTKNMRLGYAARYVPTYVKIYPHSDKLEEFGGKGSLEKYGAVLVSGEDKYNYSKIATKTTTGKPFIQRLSLSEAQAV